ncbi:MAG TPA: hypothetical protein VFF30_10710 [Nitrososphaerales archaeon]|nr:hypothetical protein [Nitrososphaerales archaeon]
MTNTEMLEVKCSPRRTLATVLEYSFPYAFKVSISVTQQPNGYNKASFGYTVISGSTTAEAIYDSVLLRSNNNDTASTALSIDGTLHSEEQLLRCRAGLWRSAGCRNYVHFYECITRYVLHYCRWQADKTSSTITVSNVLDPALQNDPSAQGGSLPMCDGQPEMLCGEAAAMGVTGGLIIADFMLGYATFLRPNLWTGYALGMSVGATFFAGGYTIDHGQSATGKGAIEEAEAGAADWYDRTDWILPFLPILGPLL